MKFATAKEHRDFFQKQGWIEFEELISNDQLSQINQGIDQVLADRFNISSENLHKLSPEELYLQGHDLWRSNQILRKFATQPSLAEIASELIEKKPLRLGCDQLFPVRSQMQFSQSTAKTYAHFLDQTISLEAVSCLQGIVCGLMLALGGKEQGGMQEVNPSVEGIDIFPHKPGHIIFFQPNVLIQWNQIYQQVGERFYLIVYTQASAHYQLQPLDPHTHSLKRLGYIFNDKLSDKLNPIVYR